MTTGGRGGGTALARLTSENVARRLVFIPITVDDALNAYTVLETLNARGLELTTTDLLKNYLFAKASSADRPSMLRRWHNLLEILESRAEVFAAVKAPRTDTGLETPDARRHITELNVFRVTQMMPLLFVVREQWTESDFVRTLPLN